MSTVLAFLVVAIVVTFLGALVAVSRQRRRERAGAVPAGERVVREARNCGSRVFVSTDVIGGPRAGRINRSPADLVMTDKRLLIATRHGRVLELTAGTGGSVRCTGPRRLVVEGDRPQKDGVMHVRAELIVNDADVWAALAAERLDTTTRALR